MNDLLCDRNLFSEKRDDGLAGIVGGAVVFGPRLHGRFHQYHLWSTGRVVTRFPLPVVALWIRRPVARIAGCRIGRDQRFAMERIAVFMVSLRRWVPIVLGRYYYG